MDGGVYDEIERILQFPSTDTLVQPTKSSFQAENLFDEHNLCTQDLMGDFDQPTPSALLFDLQFSPLEAHQTNLTHTSFSNIATNATLQHGLNPPHSDSGDIFAFSEKSSDQATSIGQAENVSPSGVHIANGLPGNAGSTLASDHHRTDQPLYSIDIAKEDANHL